MVACHSDQLSTAAYCLVLIKNGLDKKLIKNLLVENEEIGSIL